MQPIALKRNCFSESAICIRNNGEDLRFVNLNAVNAEGVNDLKKSLDKDMGRFDCELVPLDVASGRELIAQN